MTTLRKIISEIDFKNERLQCEPNWNRIAYELGIDNLPWSDDIRLTAHFIRVHYCTDSWVGVRAYFLDKEFVAISNQDGRKHEENFNFVSTEIGFKVRDYLLTLVEQNNDIDFDVLTGVDEKLPDTYKITYNTQILHKTALLDGQRVDILKTNFNSEGITSKNYFHNVLIKNGDVEIIVDCSLLDFEYNRL